MRSPLPLIDGRAMRVKLVNVVPYTGNRKRMRCIAAILHTVIRVSISNGIQTAVNDVAQKEFGRPATVQSSRTVEYSLLE